MELNAGFVGVALAALVLVPGIMGILFLIFHKNKPDK